MWWVIVWVISFLILMCFIGALDLDNADGGERVFTIKGTYDSLSYGNGLPIRAQANFSIGSWVE